MLCINATFPLDPDKIAEAHAAMAIMAEAMADTPSMIPAKTFLQLTMEDDFSLFM